MGEADALKINAKIRSAVDDVCRVGIRFRGRDNIGILLNDHVETVFSQLRGVLRAW